MSDPWTKMEEIDVTRWYNAGMSYGEIANALEPPRTARAVQVKLIKLCVLRRPGESLPPEPSRVAIAKAILRREIELAKAERATAKPFKVSPLEWTKL